MEVVPKPKRGWLRTPPGAFLLIPCNPGLGGGGGGGGWRGRERGGRGKGGRGDQQAASPPQCAPSALNHRAISWCLGLTEKQRLVSEQKNPRRRVPTRCCRGGGTWPTSFDEPMGGGGEGREGRTRRMLVVDGGRTCGGGGGGGKRKGCGVKGGGGCRAGRGIQGSPKRHQCPQRMPFNRIAVWRDNCVSERNECGNCHMWNSVGHNLLILTWTWGRGARGTQKKGPTILPQTHKGFGLR